MEVNKYIGKRGYIIRKKILTKDEIDEIISETSKAEYISITFDATNEEAEIFSIIVRLMCRVY